MISILGDPSNLGDAFLGIENVNPTVTYEGKPVAVVRTGVVLPTHYHGDTVYISAPFTGSASVYIWEVVEGTPTPMPIHRILDERTCGHTTALVEPPDGTEPIPRSVIIAL